MTRPTVMVSRPVAAGLAVTQAVVLFVGGRLAAAVVRSMDVTGLPGALWNTALMALLVVALGVVGGIFFRTGRLAAVWAGSLLLFTLADAGRTLYQTMTDDDLSYQPRGEVLTRLIPVLLGGSLVYLIVLGTAAAAGIGIGALLERSGRHRG